MTYQLGIDLGTTFTAAAVVRGPGQQPEVVTLGTRNATIPSVLFLGADGTTLVGEAAERRAVTDPDRVVREFKRRIGDPTPLVVGGRPWAPQDLSAQLVRWVVDRVAEREGGPAARTALTHPAAWGRHKLDLLADAFGRQGLQVTFLPEPSAAAVAYAANQRVEPESTIAVYDLGGGTFDAAVVRKTGTGAGFDLLGRPEGIERLGGIDFDQVVFDHVREGLPGAFDDLDDTDPEVLSAVARIRRECTEAKEALSSDTETTIQVLLPGTRGTVRMHRSEFENRIGAQIGATVAALGRAVASAGLAPQGLTAVLLVGGSSRIPLVSQMVSEQFDRPVAVDADPKNAIAKGAAIAVSPQPPAPGRIAASGAAGGRGAGSRPRGGFGAAGAAGAAAAAGAAGAAAAGGAAGSGGQAFGRSGAAGHAGGQGAPPRPPHGRLPGAPGTPPGGSASAPPGPRTPPPIRPPEGGFGSSARGTGTPPGGTRRLPPSATPSATPSTPPRRAAAPVSHDVGYDEPPRRRTQTGVYVGIGALVALVVVIVALLARGGIENPGTASEDVPPATQTSSAPATRPTTDRNPGGVATTTRPPVTSTPPPTTTSAEPEPTTTTPEPEPTTTPPEPTATETAAP
ncbi:Hsp70 family protein [Pseudonocardia sp.]|uniref:Hsp70 family protein n=1 Tax=Pseudonocardia sp. TaxID=60912 RepID=UPI003D14E1DA